MEQYKQNTKSNLITILMILQYIMFNTLYNYMFNPLHMMGLTYLLWCFYFAYHFDIANDFLWPKSIDVQTFRNTWTYNQLINKLNNIPYLNYEWEMKTRDKHMNQNTIIILKQGWTSLLSKCIIKNQT
jgi:hypothetical protein